MNQSNPKTLCSIGFDFSSCLHCELLDIAKSKQLNACSAGTQIHMGNA